MDVLDHGPYKSGVHSAMCALAQQHAPASTEFTRQAAAPVPSWSAPAAASRATFRFVAPGGAEATAALGTWYRCALPVRMHGVSSGSYEAFLRPLDDAGNAGAVLRYSLNVFPSLAPDQAIGLATAGGPCRAGCWARWQLRARSCWRSPSRPSSPPRAGAASRRLNTNASRSCRSGARAALSPRPPRARDSRAPPRVRPACVQRRGRSALRPGGAAQGCGSPPTLGRTMRSLRLSSRSDDAASESRYCRATV
jgi:hypothetical protein